MEVIDILDDVKDDIKKFIDQYKDWVVIIWWATATWKSKLSILLSDIFPVEIISADSRQIYKYMDIWTDKVPQEFQQKIKHHQIDIVNPDQLYTAGQWQKDTEKIITDIQSRWNIPMIVWWTWLYIDSIYKNFSMPEVEPDFEYRNKLMEMENQNPWILYKILQEKDPDEAMKINYNSMRFIVRALEVFEKIWKPKSTLVQNSSPKWPLLMLWLRREKEDTNKRINKRVKEMFEQWLVDEVKNIIDMWYSKDLQSMTWIWYKEVINYIDWKCSKDDAFERLKINTRQFWKRQRTWFRRYIADANMSPKDNVTYKLYNL